MSRKATTIGLLSIAAAALLLLAVLVHADSSFSKDREEISGTKTVHVNPQSASSSTRLQTAGNDVQDIASARNLALQPHAIKLLRRVGGQRFRLKTPPVVIMSGVLTTGRDRQNVQISRYQNRTGEQVELILASGGKLLSWDAASGARTPTGSLDLTERTILERLIFDSADQFILAQLRGASYQVVVRNLRPDDAPDNYTGPLWDLIRIDDPQKDEQKRSLSKWRIYHLNSITGLIDKVVCELQGERIEANFYDWTDRAGEKSPSRIVWTRQGQLLMTLNVTNVSFVAQ
jgi:hypothetical protein